MSTYTFKIAPTVKGEFSTATAYARLDIVTYNSCLYIFKTAKAAGAWDAAKAMQIYVNADIADGGSPSQF